MNNYCLYYQANVRRDRCWFFVGIMRSCENMSFDRTLNKEEGLFEFFVPQDQEEFFLKVMNDFAEREVISNLRSLPNRLELELEN